MNPVHIEVLSKSNNSTQGLFVNAVGWDYSAILLGNDVLCRTFAARSVANNTRVSVQIQLPTLKPFIVASMFAVELYIKTLLKLEATPIPKKHSLKEMFALVSSAARQRIEELYDIEFAKDPGLQELKAAQGGTKDSEFSVQYVIECCDLAFVEWRYYHEGIAASDNPNITPLKNGLRRYLIEQNPTWDEFIEAIHRK